MWTWGVMPAIKWVTFPIISGALQPWSCCWAAHEFMIDYLSSQVIHLCLAYRWTLRTLLFANPQCFIISTCHFLGTCWPLHLWSWVLNILYLISPLVAGLGGWASRLEGGIFWKQGFPQKASIFTCYSCRGSHSKILGWGRVGRWACKVSEHSQSEFQLPFKQKPSKYLGLSKQEYSILPY